MVKIISANIYISSYYWWWVSYDAGILDYRFQWCQFDNSKVNRQTGIESYVFPITYSAYPISVATQGDIYTNTGHSVTSLLNEDNNSKPINLLTTLSVKSFYISPSIYQVDYGGYLNTISIGW